MSKSPPKAILLDVNGTLFPVTAAEPAFKELGLDPSLLELWFAHVLRDAVCAQLSGVFAPFKDFAGHHLVTFAKAAQRDPTSSAPFTAEDAASKIAAAWKAAEPFPDVAPGLSQIHVAGIQIAALTNGSRDIAAAVLERASFTDLPVFDITEAKAWKPDRNSYAFAANSLLIRPSEMMMVAAHPWDCFGAMQVGMRACYVQRKAHESYPEFLDQPELVVRSFEELAEALLGLSSEELEVGEGE